MSDNQFARDPYAAFRQLRADGPISWSPEFCGGAWLLTEYADVAPLLRDPRLTTRRTHGWVHASGSEARFELGELKRTLARVMLFVDGAPHRRLRRIMSTGFTPARIQALAPRINAIVDRLLDDMAPLGACEFMSCFARPLPALVISEMLDIDPADRDDFVRWSDDIAEFIGQLTPTMEVARRAQLAIIAMKDYFRNLLTQRRRKLGDDLISLLIREEATGNVHTTEELLAQCMMLLFAGHETTRNLLGNGLLALLQNKREWDRLRRTPALMPSAVRELLRFDSPVQFTGRRVVSSFSLHGRQLRRGQLVIALIGAANRDPTRFREPDTLDIGRDDSAHLAFGSGPHACLGAMLTYLEAQIAFSRLIDRFPDLRLGDTPPKWGGNPAYRGLAALPVCYTSQNRQ